jgi:hypothetical protein
MLYTDDTISEPSYLKRMQKNVLMCVCMNVFVVTSVCVCVCVYEWVTLSVCAYVRKVEISGFSPNPCSGGGGAAVWVFSPPIFCFWARSCKKRLCRFLYVALNLDVW